MKNISDEEVKLFSRYVYEISGIVLDKSKGYLLETRLRPLLRESNIETFADYLQKVKSDPSNRLKQQIVDAISTNETFFFRDNTPFDLLRNKILPDLIDRRRRLKQTLIPLRIWSAACSSGQEVYSIAITLKETLPNFDSYKISIIGSDISDKVIAQASYGKYSRFEIDRGLPKHYLHRYFSQVGNEWRIKDEIRAMVQFKKIHLLKSFLDIGKFDIIFCRNVAIYFSQVDRRKMFGNMVNVLEPDGVLLLGGSESLSGMNLPFESNNYLRGIYYQKKGWEKALESSILSANTTAERLPAAVIAPKMSLTSKSVSPPSLQISKAKLQPKFDGKAHSGKATVPHVESSSGSAVAPAAFKKGPAKETLPRSVKTQPAKELTSPKPHSPPDGLKAGLPTETKQSLLNTLHSQNNLKRTRLNHEHTGTEKQNYPSQVKTSLLERIASQHKKK